jgi:hypothetical protein
MQLYESIKATFKIIYPFIALEEVPPMFL